MCEHVEKNNKSLAQVLAAGSAMCVGLKPCDFVYQERHIYILSMKDGVTGYKLPVYHITG